jgi:hypothetical protein
MCLGFYFYIDRYLETESDKSLFIIIVTIYEYRESSRRVFAEGNSIMNAVVGFLAQKMMG